MHRNSNIVAAVSIRFLILLWLSVHLISCDNHQRIEVNFDCQKTSIYFQCHVYNLNLFEGDKNAETYFASQPPQAPNDIRIVNSSIFYIPSHFFKTFSEIKEFVASNCSVHEIYYETFSSASKLHYLVLSFNNIKIIPDRSFQKNSDLQTLKLDHNEIQTLTTDVFRGLFTLRLLKLSYNKISHLPLYLFHDLENLVSLELNDNMISVISAGQFITNHQLTLIDLHNNALTIIDNGAFDDILDMLQVVDLTYNICVNGSMQHARDNLMNLIECCTTSSSEEMKSCLMPRRVEDESGFVAWKLVILLAFLGNACFFAFIVYSRKINLNFLRNREEHFELVGSVIVDDSYSDDQYY